MILFFLVLFHTFSISFETILPNPKHNKNYTQLTHSSRVSMFLQQRDLLLMNCFFLRINNSNDNHIMSICECLSVWTTVNVTTNKEWFIFVNCNLRSQITIHKLKQKKRIQQSKVQWKSVPCTYIYLIDYSHVRR